MFIHLFAYGVNSKFNYLFKREARRLFVYGLIDWLDECPQLIPLSKNTSRALASKVAGVVIVVVHFSTPNALRIMSAE